MKNLKDLLQEAAQIREQYRNAPSDVDRTTLKKRYDEIDREIQVLQERGTTRQKSTTRRKTRRSITREQSSEGIAAELLSVCDNITADGSISDDEVHELKSWLERNEESELPAISFLSDVISIVLQDNVVTTEERKQIYKAIESILPSDIRKYAAQKRKIAEALDKEKLRAARRAERERERERLSEERRRNTPLIDADFMVAGVKYEGRDRVVRRFVRAGDEVLLVRDPDNKFSANAVQVCSSNGRQIGFIPEEWAEDIAPLLDQGQPYRARVKKLLTGGSVHIPVVVAEVFDQASSIEGVRRAEGVTRGSRGCISIVVLTILVTLYFALPA
jgi:hypothetical protein